MDADRIRQLRPLLTKYLKRFEDCFDRQDTRSYLPVYVEGQLSNLTEKSCEPIALAAGVPPRNLQEFLANYRWDSSASRGGLARRNQAGATSTRRHQAAGVKC